MTVDEMIKMWNRQLVEQLDTFSEQAEQVRKWDMFLLENGNKMNLLQQNVEAVSAQQYKLGRLLETIKTTQEDLQSLILQLEQGLTQLPAKPTPSADELKRQYSYSMAEEVNSQLNQMSDTLLDTIRNLNKAAQVRLDQHPDNPLTHIVKILNAQMNSLLWVDQNSTDLERRIQEANAMLKNVEPRKKRF